jgi:UDP-N-acetylmuramoyl-tripeptide--D-alanyl-D-alanine ligase
MSRRYLQWVVADRERWLAKRVLIATLLGTGIATVFSEAPDSPLPGLVAVIASAFAAYPPDEGEVKKAFRRTPRATRILGAAFTITVAEMALYAVIVSLFGVNSDSLKIIALMGIGLVTYVCAPLALTLGNALMTPVEALFRRRFVASAKRIIAEIQPKVIGVTGSYGKTTTKTFITDILNGRYKVYPTPKSYNTVMGVCLAINTDLADDYSVDYFVVEMGAYVEGEIKRIADVTPPVISVVVEVGPQHLERFGTLENTAKAKYEIIEALPVDGLGVFNWDNPYVRTMYERGYPDKRIAVSKAIAPDDVPEGGPRFVASEIEETLDGLTFTVTDVERGESEPFTTSIVGEHNVTNILLATAVAVHEGMSLKDVAFRARTLQPPESRLVRRTTPEGITIINDAYSANPAGVVSALKVLGLHTSGKRALITPGMVELGDLQDAENRKLGELAAEYATDIILVGAAQTAQVKAGLLGAGFPTDRLTTVEELREAMARQAANLNAGDAVMFLNDLPDTY